MKSEVNGVPLRTEAQIEKALTDEPMSLGYKASISSTSFWGSDGTRPSYQQFLLDVEAMMAHPRVLASLSYYKAGISMMKAVVNKASSPEVATWAQQEWDNFWKRSRVQIQRSYEYGRNGYEISYHRKDGYLRFEELEDFFPLDVRVLTDDHRFWGIRILHVENRKGPLDLWGPTIPEGELKDRRTRVRPPKGLWMTHNRRYHRWYGLSQLFGAWRPWRRLAARDGAEDIVDKALFRHAIGGPEVRFPPEDYRKSPISNQTPGSQNPRSSKDLAMEIQENAQAGTGFALPSTKYPPEQGGDYKWLVTFPEHVLDVGPLDEHNEKLEKQIGTGIGVPPELEEASETGSGFSGRMIPLIGFYMRQQDHGESIVRDWKWQIGDALCKHNFGAEAWFEIEVEPIIKTMMEMFKGNQPTVPGTPPGQEDPNKQDPKKPGAPRFNQPKPGPETDLDIDRPFDFALPFEEGKHPRDKGKFSEKPGQKGEQGKEGGNKEQPAAGTENTWLAKAKEIPAELLTKARDTVKNKYLALESRYGRKQAIAIVAAGLAGAAIPLPGTSLIVAAPLVALAEIHRYLLTKAKEEPHKEGEAA